MNRELNVLQVDDGINLSDPVWPSLASCQLTQCSSAGQTACCLSASNPLPLRYEVGALSTGPYGLRKTFGYVLVSFIKCFVLGLAKVKMFCLTLARTCYFPILRIFIFAFSPSRRCFVVDNLRGQAATALKISSKSIGPFTGIKVQLNAAPNTNPIPKRS